MSDHEIIYREIGSEEPFDPSVYERPQPRPRFNVGAEDLATRPAITKVEPVTVVHLVQLVKASPGTGNVSLFVTWCNERPSTAAFDPRVATCKVCLRELHEAVSR